MQKQVAGLFMAGALLVTVGAGCSSTANVTVAPPESASTGVETTATTPPPAENDAAVMEKTEVTATETGDAKTEPSKIEDKAANTQEKTAVSVDGAMEVKVKAESQPESKPEPKSEPVPAPAKPETKTFNLTAKQFAFEPSTITVNRGDVVKLLITSADTVHGFSLPEFNLSLNIESGKTVVAEFVADKSGTFTFSCSVFCGAGHGAMRGTLIVK